MTEFKVANSDNMSTQVNNNPRLNGANFKNWKEDIQIVLGCMDLDLALRVDRPTSIEENPNKVEIEKWDRFNRMFLMIMKRSIPETFRGSIIEGTNAKGFLKEMEQYFTKNDKAEASTLMAKLTSSRYVGKGNIREYIMQMSNVATKLKALKLEVS
ncbi:uncharacterized protein LOC111020001 [Momordica charantia]|uniref:Uncharacterized protein LOC111020001 n=1 Tax=Momordica charantia TaxID=3673 RepID=A0A6J1DFM1_MOMCH|nr:uncharacterized protein LOC111020001 [Momordica charantia]